MKNQTISSIKRCNSEKELIELWKTGIPKWSCLLSSAELQEVIRAKDEKKFRLQHKAKKNRPPEAASSPSDGHYRVEECRACHGLKFWRIRGDKVWICSRCHPPVKTEGIEWIGLSR
jgi:hypothetical protein